MSHAFARVRDADWLSGSEASRRLGLSRRRLRLLLAAGHLQGAVNDVGEVGYLRVSVEAEARWRRDATRWQRWKRAAGHVLDWI